MNLMTLNASKMEWISVKDRLPIGYMVCFVWTDGFIDSMFPQILIRYENGWYEPIIDDFKIDDKHVTHWMPLLEPPKEQ